MRRIASVLATGLLLAGTAAFAQEPPRRGPGPGGRRESREEVFKMVDAYILSNLQESLGLTDEQFVKLLPLVKKLQVDRRESARAHFEHLIELRRLFESGQATEARVAEQMKTLRQAELDQANAQHKGLESIDAQLSVVQQAKFRILEMEVEQRLRNLMNQTRPGGPAAQRRRLKDKPGEP